MKETGPHREGLHSAHRVLGSPGCCEERASLAASVLSAGGEGPVLSLAMEPDSCLVMERIVG